MNDIQHDAGTDESAFVWVDGSNSTYRNFGTLAVEFPVANENHDCVRARYRSTFGVLSQGWANVECTTARGCYYCSKPGKNIVNKINIQCQLCNLLIINIANST